MCDEDVNKSQEDLDLMVRFWFRPFLDGGNSTLIHGYPICGYHESEEFDFSGEEIAFLQTRVEAETTEAGKHLLDMIQVLFLGI